MDLFFSFLDKFLQKKRLYLTIHNTFEFDAKSSTRRLNFKINYFDSF